MEYRIQLIWRADSEPIDLMGRLSCQEDAGLRFMGHHRSKDGCERSLYEGELGGFFTQAYLKIIFALSGIFLRTWQLFMLLLESK